LRGVIVGENFCSGSLSDAPVGVGICGAMLSSMSRNSKMFRNERVLRVRMVLNQRKFMKGNWLSDFEGPSSCVKVKTSHHLIRLASR